MRTWKEKPVSESSRPVKLKGKAALRSVKVKHEESFLRQVYNVYIHSLRLPLPLFFLIMLSSPLFLSVVFTCLYLLDIDGLFIPEDQEWGRKTWWDIIFAAVGERRFKIFIFSLSLSTTFGGSRVEARSPYNLLLANLNTLMAQLIFVFLSGAVFHRLSQPAEPVRWSEMVLITNDKFREFTEKAESPDHKPNKSFLVRINITGPKTMILIECKFELIYQRFVTSPGQLSPFITSEPLTLVRPEVSYLRYGLIIRHIIDEFSPLYGIDFETFLAQDASFTITISGVERSSMQPVFSQHLYAVHDGDVLWDRQFEDQILTDKFGCVSFDFTRLSQLKPIFGDKNAECGNSKGKGKKNRN